MKYDYRNTVDLMAWADESLDGMADLQRRVPVTTPDLLEVIGKSLDNIGAPDDMRETCLRALVATAIQKLSAP